jgi:asparagine synthase (glutamine-hydrolysing)
VDRIPLPLRKLMGWTAQNLPYVAYGKNKLRMLGSPTQLDRYFNTNYTPYFLRKRMLNSAWMLPADAAFLERMLPDNFNEGNHDILSKVMYFEATNLLTGDFLAKVDRASMAASLEVRCPLLDHEFCEFATRIPHA